MVSGSAIAKFRSFLYYHNQALHWAGHGARMPMSRAPRQLLTGWVAHPWPIGFPDTNFGRLLTKALKRKDFLQI
jgi:hypothetical protein